MFLRRLSRLLLLATLMSASMMTSVAWANGEECVGFWPNPDACFPDVLCPQYEQFWDIRRSVVHISGPDALGTGVLINNGHCYNKNELCGLPLILTANHVASSLMGTPMTDGEKSDIENLTAFTFNLEAAVCGGATSGDAVGVVGATVIAASPKADLLLLQLTTTLPPELGAYFVGWGSGLLDQAVSISHPCGAPKRIAISEPGTVTFQPVVGKDIYNVDYWDVGSLADGSSGAPLFDESTGSLFGVFTDAFGAGAHQCFDPNAAAQHHFTALTTLLEFLPSSIDANMIVIGSYDSNDYLPPAGTVKDSSYYGEGEVVNITAEEQVLLVDGFWADSGSTIVVEVGP
jgi:hypothetical protein